MQTGNSYLHKFRILLVLIAGVGLLFSSIRVLAETHYFVGDIITVPITYTTTLPVIVTDFNVIVTGGELVDLTCGGSGFIVNNGSGNHCTLVHLPPGATSGTVATAHVRGLQAGTLKVTVEGTLDAALSLSAVGSFSESSYLIEDHVTTTPTPSPSSGTTGSSQSGTTGSSTTSSTSASSTASTSTTTGSQTTTTNKTTSTTTNTSKTTPGSTGTATSTQASSRLVITADDVKTNQPILVGNYQEVFFTVDALPAALTPVTLDFPEEQTQTWLNFSSYMSAGQTSAEVTLPQTLMFRNKVGSKYITTMLPEGTVLSTANDNTVTGSWNGLMLAPSAAESQEGNQKILTLHVGDLNRGMNLSKPAELILSDYSGWKGSVRESDRLPFQAIGTTCNTASDPLTGISSGECFIDEGKDLQIFTNHFSEFKFTHVALSWETILLIATEILLLAFILITLRPHTLNLFRRTRKQQEHLSQLMKASHEEKGSAEPHEPSADQP